MKKEKIGLKTSIELSGFISCLFLVKRIKSNSWWPRKGKRFLLWKATGYRGYLSRDGRTAKCSCYTENIGYLICNWGEYLSDILCIINSKIFLQGVIIFKTVFKQKEVLKQKYLFYWIS